jgi:FG-GAP-like repeat
MPRRPTFLAAVLVTCSVFGCSRGGTSTSGNSGTSNAASLTFSPRGTFDAGGVGPNCVQTSDLNGDGKLDLVITNQKSNNVAVLFGNGDGTFQAAITFTIGNGPRPVCAVVADFNNDGKPDIAVANAEAGPSSGTVSMLINHGDGTFFPAFQVNSNISALCLIAADLDKDGNQDLWIGGNGSSAVLFGKGDGTFQAPQIFGIISAFSVAIGDLNADTFADLAGVTPTALIGPLPAGQLPISVEVLLNRKDGTFGPNVALYAAKTTTGPTGIALGDFNHDGKLDAAVTNSGTGEVSILLGNGDGTFQPQSFFSVGNVPGPIVLADFDGTGRIDFAVGTQNADGKGVRVYLGNGDGTFTFLQGLATGPGPTYLTIGDFNGDKVPDIADIDFTNNTVSVFVTQRPH